MGDVLLAQTELLVCENAPETGPPFTDDVQDYEEEARWLAIIPN